MMNLPVGFAYATYGGLTITAVTLFGIFKYNQIPNIFGVMGIILIIVGVILVNYLGKTNYLQCLTLVLQQKYILQQY